MNVPRPAGPALGSGVGEAGAGAGAGVPHAPGMYFWRRRRASSGPRSRCRRTPTRSTEGRSSEEAAGEVTGREWEDRREENGTVAESLE